MNLITNYKIIILLIASLPFIYINPNASINTNNTISTLQSQKHLQNYSINENITTLSPNDILIVVNKNNRLPSNYVPKNLVIPKVPFTYKEFSSKKLMKSDAALALEKLFEKAKQDNINLYAMSGYRSYAHQEAIFTSKVKKYGIQSANRFSAKPGESEHQTGLAMDLTSSTVNFRLTQHFAETKEGKWLKQNAHKFGFIIRYPKGKEHITGYRYEPWHIRYVGIKVAKELSNRNITLEEYLNQK